MESVKVLKDGSIGGSEGQFDLGELGEDAEEPHRVLGHQHVPEDGLAALVGKHISFI